ncbi:hypothetical protein [Sphingomonas sp. Marseille-Q8236]|jgi:hypothetical protein
MMMAMIADRPARPWVAPMPDLPGCPIKGAGPEMRRMADLPPSVRQALRHAIGNPVAEAGSPFNGSDMVSPGSPPRTRFLRAYRVRDLWLVWVEQGGIAHVFRLLAFRDGPHGASAPVPMPLRGRAKLCTASRAIGEG